MIDKLNETALIKADQTAFRVALIRKINKLVDAVNVGVVHDNKVEADRNNVEVSAMVVDMEYKRVLNELQNVAGGVDNV